MNITRLSIIIPAYNEQATISSILNKIKEVVLMYGRTYEEGKKIGWKDVMKALY